MDISFLTVAFTMGLFSSVHCLGMCGGISGALAMSLPGGPRSSARGLLPYLAAYNGGRVFSYGVAGALSGALGAGAFMAVSPEQGLLVLRTVAAVVVVAIGLYLAGWFPALALVERIGTPVWRRLEPLGRRLLPVRHPLQALAYGAVWGWLPCGLVYSTLLWAAAAGGPLEGGLTMVMFGLGTLPAIMGAGAFSRGIVRVMRMPYVRPVAGLAIVVAGLASLVYTSGAGPADCLPCGVAQNDR